MGLAFAQHVLSLNGSMFSPGLVSYGSPLGLSHIIGEPSTSDGFVAGPMVGKVPKILGGDGAIIRAADGLLFGTRNAL